MSAPSERRPYRRVFTTLVMLVVILTGTVGSAAAEIGEPPTVGPAGIAPDVQIAGNATSPAQFFGYEIGADYMLTPWMSRPVPNQGARKGIVDYAYELQRTSKRVHTFEFGKSTMGLPQIYMVITSPDNWAQIERLKGISRRLADPRQIVSDAEARELARSGKIIYWISGGIHSTERTSPEVLTRLAYKLAAYQDPWTKSLMDNVIVIIEPASNPDGLEMVTDWYYQYLGTPYEPSSPPCYNKYMCHDNNRDFFGLNLVESRNIANARDEWKAQQHLDLHEAQTMLYMSPSLDPPNEAIDGIARAEWLAYSANAITKMVAADWHGVFTYNYPDVFYPGYNESWSNMHNGLGTYWELRGARRASPITITSGGYPVSWYNPYPIEPPFTWRLADAVNLEEDGLFHYLDYTQKNSTALLYNFYLKGKRNMAAASRKAPYAWVIPAHGGDNADVTDMINNLLANKIEVQRATAPFNLDGQDYVAGDYIVRTDQPYGLTAKNYLSTQSWPAAAGTPYDVTAWTYQYMRDVAVVPVNTPLPAIATTPVTTAEAYKGLLAGDVSQWYAIEHESNNNLARALPQIWARAGMTVYQADVDTPAGGLTYPAGTFFVQTSGSAKDHAWLKSLVEGLGLKAASLASGVSAAPLKQPRVGLYAPYSSPMNEGWIRLRLDVYAFPYTRLFNADISAPAVPLQDAYDVIILPSNSPNSIRNGNTSSSTPPEIRGGIGQQGIDNLKAFVEAGGVLVLNGASSTLPIQFGWGVGVNQPSTSAMAATVAERLPAQVQEAAEAMTLEGETEPDRGLRDPNILAAAPVPVYFPGSILAVQVDSSDPVSFGYEADEAIWGQNHPYFAITNASARAAAWYPADRDALLSGYLTGGEGLRGMAAIVDAALGQGRVVMFGTDPVYRGQSTGTYMFFFNALLMGGR